MPGLTKANSASNHFLLLSSTYYQITREQSVLLIVLQNSEIDLLFFNEDASLFQTKHALKWNIFVPK